ncbi:hypothetical protein F5878DRAFT_605532 [Lentinula raphanica]|uniref:Uncharacterized protein n=1 Tax=Lentinula raphanica TaxID=153919 RepID=A0AA38PHV3_9AGAR|nr:hypothetical protein F5878DRAFT_605532 [Lentinula raphanica]
MYLAVARSAAIASRVLALLCLGAAVTSTIGALAAHTPSFRVQALQSRSSPPVQESPSKLRVEHVNLVPRVENDAPEEGSKAAGNDANFSTKPRSLSISRNHLVRTWKVRRTVHQNRRMTTMRISTWIMLSSRRYGVPSHTIVPRISRGINLNPS